MPAKPPPIPEIALARVTKVAKIDGTLIMLFAGAGAFMAAMAGEYVATAAALLAAGTGAMEIHGSHQLDRDDAGGVIWAMRAQLLLLLVIFSYAVYQMTHFDAEFWRQQLPQFREMCGNIYGPNHPALKLDDGRLLALLKFCKTISYAAVAITTCVFQGLMARYYNKNRAPVEQALDYQDE